MKHMTSTMVRAAAAVVTAILMTIAVGAFLPTPTNPAQFRAIQEKLDVAVATDMVFREGEADQYLATPSGPAPSYIVAILDWHSWLLALFSVISVLLLRPRLVASIASASIATIVLYFSVGFNSAVFLLISFVFTAVVMHFVHKRQAARHGNAA
jgi:hypothetical protein